MITAGTPHVPRTPLRTPDRPGPPVLADTASVRALEWTCLRSLARADRQGPAAEALGAALPRVSRPDEARRSLRRRPYRRRRSDHGSVPRRRELREERRGEGTQRPARLHPAQPAA